MTNKITALCISAFFTSLAGTLYSQYTLYVDPTGSFNLITSQKAAILTIVGGSGTIFFGPLIGGLILGPTEIFLRGWLGSTFQGAYLVIYGVLLVVVVLAMPQGIVGAIKKNIRTKKVQHVQEEMLKAEVKRQHNHVHKKL